MTKRTTILAKVLSAAGIFAPHRALAAALITMGPGAWTALKHGFEVVVNHKNSTFATTYLVFLFLSFQILRRNRS